MRRRLSAVCTAVILFLVTSAFAQERYNSHWAPTDNPHVTMIAGPGDSDSGLYLLAPGYYVKEPSDRADYWSPHYRPFPDYSYGYPPRGIHRLPRNRIGGLWGGSNYGYPYSAGWNCGGCGTGYGCGHAPLYSEAAGAYNQGRYDADHEYLWAIASQRAGRLINQSADFFDEGILLFRDGQYDRAAIKWLGAGDVNQGSAATRLHAGHAMFALGRYSEGVTHLARAFELSPSLAYKTYDIRDEYGDHAEFHQQLMRLKDHAARSPNDAAVMTMLGYVLFFTEGPGASLRYLERAGRLDPNSFFIPKLLTLARQASPAEGVVLPRRGDSANAPYEPQPGRYEPAPMYSPRPGKYTTPSTPIQPRPIQPRATPKKDTAEKVRLARR